MTEVHRPGAVGSWRAMADAFITEGLAVPPIPSSLRHELRTQADWCWATRPVSPFDMYLFRPLPTEELYAAPVADYVAVSHAGHGVNSYAITYHLVYRQLALFLQIGWGGVYTDNAAAAAELQDVFAQCQTLIAIADELDADTTPWRLVCIESPLRGVSACGWVRLPRSNGRKAAWQFLNEHRVRRERALGAAERLLRHPPAELRGQVGRDPA